MSETNKSYRIRTKVGDENTTERLEINEDLVQEYDVFEILSVDIKSRDMYRLHNSNHGIVVGRVLANNGFGIPNAKISIFIKSDGQDNVDISGIYPFSSSVDKDENGVKYNLLPNERVSPCHQVVGTFPSKKYVLDNDVILEVFDKYYKYTAKTNNAGDYLICGVPTGSHTLHMDLDISDCGILSQRPRDFIYKGYTIEQFESPTKFKSGTDYENLSQIFTQDQVVNVNPLWGNESLGETIGLTRADIKVNFKFEPTCVFMGSIVSDNSSNGFTRKCIATDNMGMMEELVTGEGTIEMIRKTPGGDIEGFSIKGNKLINANGIWCYQIPMNLDYMATDEYGNMVPTDNPEKGIPTRASVRFRISMDDHEENKDNFHRGKVLVPHNPQILENGNCEDYDYNFGSYTRDDSFRDLYWNNVYSVKSYIPRIQKHRNPKRLNYSGIKRTNDFGGNNPMPYNNIRIRMPLMFMILCVLIKCYVLIVRIYNTVLTYIGYLLANLSVRVKWFKFTRNGYGWLEPWGWCFYLSCVMKSIHNKLCDMHLVVLKDGLCPDLENWFFVPTSIANSGFFSVDTDCRCSNILGSCCGSGDDIIQDYNILQQTLDFCVTEGDYDDPQSIDDQNEDPEDSGICLTRHTDYLISCIEMNLAQEYKVINFDFYNDWINGTIYNPRWTKYTAYKRKYFFWGAIEAKVKGCMDDTRIFSTARKYTQQCAIGYEPESYFNQADLYTRVSKPNDMDNANKFHKRKGMKQFKVFGSNGGVCHEQKTIKGQNVYYLKPCEFTNGRKVILFATDIILLGSFNDCDINGIPQAFKHLTGSTYIMPTNLALTNMDTNGPLYADNDMTICMQRQPSLSGDVLTKKIQEIQGSALTFATEIGFYSGNVNYTLIETDYPKGIELDTIPMTEAAGISWDYTGPGQADKDKYSMYYPGGHFLGLTCINSQTNIKSCINLSRICEIGTIMSQRKENVDGIELINDGKDGGHLTYNYIVPSGFISGDEIVDSDFRSMFATMNKKRLIATKINSKTGYKYYDFEFSNAINFDGTFSKLATPASKYNRRQDIEDEDLTAFGIKLGKDRDDYDPNESGKTITKTKEFVDLDYYLFRFGLTYKDLENGLKIRNKFLLSGDESYLPQYENSYYFYFGLTNGSTALDEFNKQFYSECDPITFRPEKNVKIIPELHFKEGYGYIDVVTQGLTLPIQRIIIEKKYDRDYLQILKGDDFLHMFLSEQFRLKQLSGSTYTEKFKSGSYRVTIVDSDGEVRSEIVSLGDDLYNYSVTVFNFNQPVSKAHINYIDSATTSIVTGGADEVNSEYEGNLRGGSLRISDFSIRGYDYSDTSIFEYVRFRLEYDYNVGYTYTTNNSYSGGDEFVYGKYKKAAIIQNHPDINNENTEKLIDLPCSLNIVYKCKNGNGGTYDEVSVPVAEYYIDDNLYVALKGGSRSELNCHLFYSKEDTEEEEDVSYSSVMSGMSLTWWWDDNNLQIGNSEYNNERWFYRALFYDRENNPENPFRVKVYAENGKIALWGMAQNNNGIAGKGKSGPSGTSFCNMLPNEYFPDDCVLDEKVIYFPSYGITYTGSSAITNTEAFPDANGTKQYSMISYNDNDVCGHPKGLAQQTGTSGVSSMTINIYDSNYFHNGYGCVFKPVPDGKLLFITYNDKTESGITYYYMKKQLSDRNWKYGLLYPTFIFPVINRPFQLDLKYVYWTHDEMTWPREVEKWMHYHQLFGRNTYLTIKNGITSANKIGFIPMPSLFNILSVSGISSALTLSKMISAGKDGEGLTLESSNPREITMKESNIRTCYNESGDKIPCNYNNELPPKQKYCGYEIKEGFRNINGKSGQYLANRYSYSYELDLPDEIYYDLEWDNGSPTNRIKSITPSKTLDDETKLYLMYFPNRCNSWTNPNPGTGQSGRYWTILTMANLVSYKFNLRTPYSDTVHHKEDGLCSRLIKRLYFNKPDGGVIEYFDRSAPSAVTQYTGLPFMYGSHPWIDDPDYSPVSINPTSGETELYFYATLDFTLSSSGNLYSDEYVSGLHGREVYITLHVKMNKVNNTPTYRFATTASTEYINDENERKTLSGSVITDVYVDLFSGGTDFDIYYGHPLSFCTIIGLMPNIHLYYPFYPKMVKSFGWWPIYKGWSTWYTFDEGYGYNGLNYGRVIDELLENDVYGNDTENNAEILIKQEDVYKANVIYPYLGERLYAQYDSAQIGALCVKTHVDENLNKTTIYKMYERLKPRNNSLAR